LLVNNAGYGVFASFQSVEFSVWEKQLLAMLVTTARLNHAAMAKMIPQTRGCIVNVASMATEFPLPYMAGYNMAKAGLSALSESLALEAHGTGVAVIDFRPGDFCTDFNRSVRGTPGGDARMERVWQILEKNLKAAPAPSEAACALRKALLRRSSGVVRCGSFFQSRVAPFLSRFASTGLRRAVASHYFGCS
jgi:short-subunit dehydrogenase